MGRQSAGLLQRPGVPTEPSSTPDPPAMLTVKQVARALKVGEQMVYRQLEQGTLLKGEVQPQRIGRLWRIPRREFCAQKGIPETYDFGD